MRIEVSEAPARLDKLLELVEAGQTVLFCRDGRPVATMSEPSSPGKSARPIGLAKGAVQVPPEFFDALPDDLLDLFEGKGDDGLL